MGALVGPLPTEVNRGPSILALSWVEAALGISILAARLYTRGRIVRNVGWDDWTMAFSTLLAVITTCLVTLEVHYGTGRHAVYLSSSDITNSVKIIWLTVPFSTMSACFGKISIALLLMRIMDRKKSTRHFLWFLIIALFIVNLLLTIITFAQCTPVTFLWDRTNPDVSYHGTCWDHRVQQDYGYFQGAFSSFSDLILALYPLTFIWNLQLKLKIKIGLGAVMSLGLIATIASVYKTVELQNLATPDFTFDATNLVLWYMTENWLIIIAACIPTLGPLYQIITGKASADAFRRAPNQTSRWTLFRLKSLFSSKGSSNRSEAYSASRSDFSKLGRDANHSMDPIINGSGEYAGGIRATTDIHIV